MYNDTSSNPVLTNVTISGNSANYGGGVFNIASSPTLTNVTISGNTANRDGGGMCNDTNSPTLTNVIISGNSATGGGGGMANYIDSSPTLTNVTISGNTADYGGGMYNELSSLTLTNVTVSGNTASSEGGGMQNNSSSPTLTNVIISGNTATVYGGGGVYNLESSPTLTNVTISGNTAGFYGSGMYNDVSSNPQIRNSIIWGNTLGDGTTVNNLENNPSPGIPASTPVFSYTLLEGSTSAGIWVPTFGTNGGNNLDSDPKFVNPIATTNVPTTTGDYRLQATSPAINTGDNAVITTTTDLDGSPRIMNGSVDMGAYEYGPVVRRIVRADPNPTNAATVTFTVTFNVNVSGVDATDFTLTKTDGQDVASTRIASVSSNGTSTTTWTVAVSTTDLVSGTIRLDLVDNDTIVDTSSTPLGGSGMHDGDFSSGEVYTVDRRAPTVVLSTSVSDPTNVSPIPVTVTFSEAVTGFLATDVLTGNGTLGNFTTVSGSVYTFTLTPLANGVVTTTLNANVATNAAGNGNTAATLLSRTYDGTAPTVVLSTSAGDPTNASPIPVTVTFSEAVTGFAATDVLTGNGTLGNFTTVSGSVYTFTLTPLANGVVTTTLNANVATDAAGNGNSAATTFSITYARSSANADLSALTLSTGTLSPTFAAAKTSYTVAVSRSVTSLIVTPTVSDTNATVTVNGVSATTPISLSIGVTRIMVRVTAQDGTTNKTYMVYVMRAGEADVEITQSYKLEKGTSTTAQAVSLAAISNTLTLTITVRNNGPDAVAGVLVADTFPAAAVGTVWRWTCTATGGADCGTTSGSGNLNQALGLLPKDGVVTFVVTGSLLNPNTWSNTPSVTAPTGVVDTNTSNNSITVGNFMTFVPLVVK